MEELFEATTWAQLNYHTKPVGLLNTRGFFDPVVQWVESAIRERFIRPAHAGLMTVADQPAALLSGLERATVPALDEWLQEPPL
jgi:predicted Rossmann-fold nucleotide-binding protein